MEVIEEITETMEYHKCKSCKHNRNERCQVLSYDEMVTVEKEEYCEAYIIDDIYCKGATKRLSFSNIATRIDNALRNLKYGGDVKPSTELLELITNFSIKKGATIKLVELANALELAINNKDLTKLKQFNNDMCEAFGTDHSPMWYEENIVSYFKGELEKIKKFEKVNKVLE